ncbi:ABC transporter substrate-binding protein [Patulibacter sp.]|uniref:ABC transporter substrate-binding protein n=1 Tax=Patulibacter sp. TaxID=1912859 RepID=UPI0027232529|nr:ABC transporter substrate-binding protein [Patulibacter sp.]MDO9407186.1 ABC transporter substrate-binding protein [Patulibacter sp.]
MRTPTLGALAATAVLAISVTGCGSSDDDESTAGASTGTTAAKTTKVNDAAVALLPADVKSKGTLTVAADASYPPNEFFDKDGKTIIGLDPDLAQALGTALGLKMEVQNAGFDGIIAGLQSGKYDLGMSSFTDNKEREEVVNFVTYLSAGTSFFVNAQKDTQVTDLASLCGKKVAVEKGTVQLDDATAQAKKCGSNKLTVLPYPDQNGANQALAAGRADVSMADSPVADYQVKLSNGALKLAGTPYGTAPYGIAIPKNLKIEKALQTALKGLIDDGTYQSVLDKWGLEKSAAIADPVINGAQD